MKHKCETHNLNLSLYKLITYCKINSLYFYHLFFLDLMIKFNYLLWLLDLNKISKFKLIMWSSIEWRCVSLNWLCIYIIVGVSHKWRFSVYFCMKIFSHGSHKFFFKDFHDCACLTNLLPYKMQERNAYFEQFEDKGCPKTRLFT